jgi:hypothetical protein
MTKKQWEKYESQVEERYIRQMHDRILAMSVEELERYIKKIVEQKQAMNRKIIHLAEKSPELRKVLYKGIY